MKIVTLLVAGLFVSIAAQATVRTVSNSPNMPAQFTDLQTAINTAVTGDTLYVMGTGVQYGQVTIDKQLTVIGTGHAPPAPAQPAWLSTIYIYTNATGTKLIGLYSDSYVYIYCSNVTIERCRIYYIYPQVVGLSNLVFRHNYVTYVSFNNPNSALFANNIVHNNGYIQNSNSPSVLIANNLFMGYYWNALSAISNALISNNIFWQSTPVAGSVTNCTFENNITYQTPNNTIPFGTNSGSGNLVDVNPQFVNVPDAAFNTAYNYDLLPASAGNNAGSDGTDIGLYGGVSPWPNQSGLARIPFITSFTLQYSQVPQGSTVNGTVNATKVD
ncbi:MAG TPA: hypothetical protein PKY96_12875 [Flavobacteriales bacterium]|nr:hypothetical protein [Flavobacteriales bacterium]